MGLGLTSIKQKNNFYLIIKNKLFSSSEWQSLSESNRLDAGLVKVFDGEFWMCFDDFLNHWDSVQICHMTPESFSEQLFETDRDGNLEWHCTYFQSEWIRGKNAGGCGNGDTGKK